ncbi:MULTISPECIES: isopentenyl-diphosphate Delta-isomerase [Chelativorans]|jgi:isopentenyl-diphosphate delta-isomerase|uniref:Isopentenyl-diphosphate Delta-isomerase n=1 Tax=Chelativorans sp. (strain BNC1) TaxID=266779 RepID=Q11MV0_CHESB|nr:MULTISPECIES: isopentenyl-diphosphate Delta-isomerase [Chelativorans]
MITRAEGLDDTPIRRKGRHPPDEQNLILVDANDRAVGSAGKLIVHQRNMRHRAISVLIFDSAGRMLLQRRSAAKYHSGGLWTNACCSHPRPGESPAHAAERRLGEEMGFVVPLSFVCRFQYGAPVGNGLWENEIVHVFSGLYDGEIVPDADGADDFRWQALASIRDDIATRADHYTAWFRLYEKASWFEKQRQAAVP